MCVETTKEIPGRRWLAKHFPVTRRRDGSQRNEKGYCCWKKSYQKKILYPANKPKKEGILFLNNVSERSFIRGSARQSIFGRLKPLTENSDMKTKTNLLCQLGGGNGYEIYELWRCPGKSSKILPGTLYVWWINTVLLQYSINENFWIMQPITSS